jgi:hypothetical protein
VAKPGHIYHWKHGWIPITPRAAMVKAKGRRGLADKYMHHFGIEDKRSGSDRRQGGDLGGNGHRKGGDDRGSFTYKRGTKTRDYPDRPASTVHNPVHKHPVGSTVDARQPGIDKVTRGTVVGHDDSGMVKVKYQDRHGNDVVGTFNPHHVTKAPDAERPPVPVRPSKDFRPGHDVPTVGDDSAPNVRRTSGLPTAADRSHNAETMHGTGSAEHLRALEMENREIEHGLPSGHRLEAHNVKDPITGNFRGTLNAHYVGDDRIGSVVPKDGTFRARYMGSTIGVFDSRDEAHKAMASHHAKTLHAANGTGELDPNDLEAEDHQIGKVLPQGEAVSGSVGKTFRRNDFGGRDTVQVAQSTHFKNGRTIGYVKGDGLGGYLATHRYIPAGRKNYKHEVLPGVHATREAAHKHLSDVNAAHEAKLAKNAERKAAANAKKLDVLRGVAGPNGTSWEPFVLEHDGTLGGRAAAQKAKMAFRAGDHTVVIETTMSAEHAKGLLADITNATERAAPNLKGPVKFLVPTGEKWTGKNGGTVGAFVHVNGTTVHINPKVADNTHARAFQNSAEAGHFVPGAKTLPPREFTILHELGHVVDNQNHHTPDPGVNTFAHAFGGGERYQPGAEGFHQEHSHGHSEYGKDSAAEGYAEAFAQWSIAGPGQHKVADTYAEQYGWAKPAAPARASVNPFGEDAGIKPSGSSTLDDIGRESQAGNLTREQFAKRIDDFERQLGLGKYAKTGQESSVGGTRISHPASLAAGHRIEHPATGRVVQVTGKAQYVPPLGGGPAAKGHYNIPTEGGTVRVLEGSTLRQHGAVSPFDAEHSAGLAKADAARTKPLSSTVRGVKDDLATLPADVQARLLKGRSVDSMTSEELSALRKAVMAYHIKRRKG